MVATSLDQYAQGLQKPGWPLSESHVGAFPSMQDEGTRKRKLPAALEEMGSNADEDEDPEAGQGSKQQRSGVMLDHAYQLLGLACPIVHSHSHDYWKPQCDASAGSSTDADVGAAPSSAAPSTSTHVGEASTSADAGAASSTAAPSTSVDVKAVSSTIEPSTKAAPKAAGAKGKFCLHGRQRYFCKECGGKGICEHGRERRRCKECGGKGICEHGRQHKLCKECGGSGICEHGRQRHRCKECGGSGI